jgi:hypothetical protein
MATEEMELYTLERAASSRLRRVMPSAASWERNSSLDGWHVGEIEDPGVYVGEVPLDVAPIAGVEMSTTGFIGEVGSAEPCAPAHMKSLVEVERASARAEVELKLGTAIAQFFENGGSHA